MCYQIAKNCLDANQFVPNIICKRLIHESMPMLHTQVTR